MTLVITGWLGICAVWAGLLVAQFRAKQRGMFLAARIRAPSASAGFIHFRAGHNYNYVQDTHCPTVCVVIPARNESLQIAECLASVLAQDYPAFDVLVVDDRSEDDTGVVVGRIAESDPRLRVMRIESLPEGWLGKSHALWQATRAIKSEWILFLDADCKLAPSALRVAVDEAVRRDAALLTLWPRNRAEGFWEHVLIPLCAGIIALWYSSDRVNSPKSKLAFANGQFLLIRRDEYERIGGHRSVRRAVIEDIPLAEQAKQAGVRCHVASGRELFSVRMYSGYKAIRDGWARIYVGALRSSPKIALSIAWLGLGSLLPFVAVFILFIPAASGLVFADVTSPSLAVLRWCCGLHLALLLIVSYRFWGLGACRRRYLILYPLSVILVMRILWRAWWWLTVKRSIPWSTTVYRINGEGVIVG